MSNDTSPFEHLTNTIDGYARATDDRERRMFLRVAMLGFCSVVGAVHVALLALASAVDKGAE
jgi:hypothetical protein